MLKVDAAAVISYIIILPDGNVEGFVEPLVLDSLMAAQLIGDSNLFQELLKSATQKLIKAEFVCMLAAIDGSIRPFPICCVSANFDNA